VSFEKVNLILCKGRWSIFSRQIIGDVQLIHGKKKSISSMDLCMQGWRAKGRETGGLRCGCGGVGGTRRERRRGG